MGIQAIRGMHDILPADIHIWQSLEASLRRLTASYGYQEIRFPILEETQLFKRTIGTVTDIVEKEMYEFVDRNGTSIALRPEGTAGCVRAGIEHGLTYNQIQRLWYMGPMYRHERPQKGRYRQFYQFGLEAFGLAGPDIDAEMILFTARLWGELGVSDKVTLHLNSIGTTDSRAIYRDILVEYFLAHQDKLDEDSKRRLGTNPMRILDSKNPDMRELVQQAPVFSDYLDDESKQHFTKLCKLLDAAGIKYKLDPYLVRGLDYYSKTVFEWITDELGAQGTICAGGRYDALVELLGGKATPGVGFAMGLERIIELMKMNETEKPKPLDAYLVLMGDAAQEQGLQMAEKIRGTLPTVTLITHCGGGNFKRQFKQADKSGARIALILGEEEIENQMVSVKFLREDKPQQTVNLEKLYELLVE